MTSLQSRLGRSVLSALAALLVMSALTRAQDYRGKVQGVVTDVSNAALAGANDIQLDGVPLTSSYKTSYTPSIEAVQEVSFQKNAVDSEYGYSGGGIVTLNMKSGTNRYYGSAYYHNRNPRFNAFGDPTIVRNCVMKDGHGGVVMGSEISGGVRNVFVENCKMDSPNLDRALRFKSNAKRGGVIENVFMRNVEVGRVAEAILTIDFLYETGANGPHKPVVRNVTLENVRSASSPRVMWIAGFQGAVIDNIRFADCAFRGVESSEFVQNAGSISFKNVTIEPANKGRSRNSPETKP